MQLLTWNALLLKSKCLCMPLEDSNFTWFCFKTVTKPGQATEDVILFGSGSSSG